MDLNALIARLWKRVGPFFDLSAWILLLVALVPLFLIDRAMALTLVQWTAYGLALAGVSVVISRATLPQIDVSEWLDRARNGDVCAPWIVLAVALYLGLIFLGLVLWAKA